MLRKELHNELVAIAKEYGISEWSLHPNALPINIERKHKKGEYDKDGALDRDKVIADLKKFNETLRDESGEFINPMVAKTEELYGIVKDSDFPRLIRAISGFKKRIYSEEAETIEKEYETIMLTVEYLYERLKALDSEIAEITTTKDD